MTIMYICTDAKTLESVYSDVVSQTYPDCTPHLPCIQSVIWLFVQGPTGKEPITSTSDDELRTAAEFQNMSPNGN